MLLRGREKQVFSILSKDQEGENERKEKKAARGKSGNWQLLLPYLYPVSNPKAESHIQSQVWGDPSEHNITMALLQHLVPPAPLPPALSLLQYLLTHCLNQSLFLLPGTLHQVSSNT